MCDIKKIRGMKLVDAAKLVAAQIEDVVNECQDEGQVLEKIDKSSDLLKKLSEVRENARLLLLVTNLRLGSAARNIQIKMEANPT